MTDDTARGVVIDAAQRILVVGDFRWGAGSDRDCGILRLLPDASSYDPGFLPPLGYGYFNFNRGGANTDQCHAVAAYSDGSSLVVGSASVAGDRNEGIVMRLGPDGLPDPAFFDDGVFDSATDGPMTLAEHDLSFRQVLIDADARAVVSGDVVAVNEDVPTGVGVVLRFAADGTLDAGFGVLLGTPALGTFLRIAASAIDAQGAYWFAGNRHGSSDGDGGYLFRVLPDGSLDPGFNGAEGYVVSECASIRSLAIDAGARVLMGCFPHAGSGRFPGVLRYRFSAGEWQADPAFGSGGHTDIVLSPSDHPEGGDDLFIGVSQIAALRVLGDGRILLAGSYSHGRDAVFDKSDAIAARLSGDGSLDAGYGSGGIVAYGFAFPDRNHETAYAMALDASERPVLAGRSAAHGSTVGKYIVARLQQRGDAVFADGFE